MDELDFIRTVQSLSGKYSLHTVWSDFISVCACTISNSVDRVRFAVREKVYLDIAKKYAKEGLATMSRLLAATAIALERNPAQDFLGSVYTHLRLQQQEPLPDIYSLQRS